MKILIVLTPPFDPFSGGVQMSTFKLSKKFSEMSYETIIYSFSNTGHITPDYTKLYYSEKDKLHYNNDNIQHFYNIVKKERPYFIINQMPYENEITSVIQKVKEEFGIKTIACLHNSLFSVKMNIDLYIKNSLSDSGYKFFNNSLGRYIFQKIHKIKHAKSLKRILDVYDTFVMFGEPNNMEIKYFIGDYKQEKLAYIPNSIPYVEENLPKKEKRILWLSRLSYGQKQAQYILPLWEKLHDRLPDWHLDIVGDGDAYADIESQIKKKNLPRITLYGKQKPDSYYKRSPIYLMTSSHEGFPNTVIEAQSYGCIPIVFNSYPMASWIINDGTNGFLTKPDDIDEMAETILNLTSNPDNMLLMNDKALENATRFHIDKIGDKWQELFHELSR